MMLKVLVNKVLMSVRQGDYRMLGVLWDKMLGVVTGPDRTLVANHPHQRYDGNDDNPSTNDNNNNNNDDRL